MTMYVMCDVCDNQIDGEFITLAMPEQFVPAGPADQEEYEFHVCGWECLYVLSQGMTGNFPEQEEPEPERVVSEPTLAETAVRLTKVADPRATHGEIVMNNLPLDQRAENDFEVPLAGITKDRREIRIPKRS